VTVCSFIVSVVKSVMFELLFICVFTKELTEEGLPFVILFHHPDDTNTPDMLRKQVANELMNEKSKQ